MSKPRTQLIDLSNIESFLPSLLEKFSTLNQFNGFDLETEDSRRHEGMNRAMKMDEDGYKGATTKLLFDLERTTVTGFSLYKDGDDVAYYFNLAHADVQNRIPFQVIRPILDAIKEKGYFVAHKAPFELTMMEKCLGYSLGNKVICTLQLAVTCFNDDTYPIEKFLEPGLGDGFKRLLSAINLKFQHYEPGAELDADQEELLFKFIAKESSAEHSYNGYVASIKYGYALKRLSKYFLGYDQVTFQEVLGTRAHMGQLTGAEVASYGADDAWTCMHLYHKLMEYLLETNPKGVVTFFNQENPMIHVYSKVWRQGVVTNKEAVLKGQAFERKEVAELLRKIKGLVRSLLPFPENVHEKLVKYDPKYKASKYRADVIRWVTSKDSDDDFTQLMQCRTSLSKEWAEASKVPESTGPSITYYQFIRCLFYDLCGCSFQQLEGKVQSDQEAQDRWRSRWLKKNENKTDDPVIQLLDCYKKLNSKNQVIKLYINNYLNLIDPETSRVYPHLSSMLNSRRMALETPNLSQLAKNSDIAYVRSYFEPDEPDHVLISADWSGIELVLIGEESGDPEFAKVFGTLPHGDLHTGTTADLLSISIEELKAKPDFKKLRTDIGKGGNFGYWYSGALGTVARELNLSSETMWEFTERYRTRFAVGEQWRANLINSTKITGRVQLPDGNVRYRFESTPIWANYMQDKFASYNSPAVIKFGNIAIRKIQNRSGNQAVNSNIQGLCATLAKRSIIKMEREILELAKSYRATFKFPVHDELVYSVHKDDAVTFMKDLRHIMCNHPMIVKNLKLDASMAVGKNYWAYDKEKNPKGQIELDEASKVPCLPENRWGAKLTDEERQTVINYLME